MTSKNSVRNSKININFPDRINTEFVKVIDRHTLQMRVWERGSGETLACGTGACAVAVASTLNGLVDEDKPVTVKLLGGDLHDPVEPPGKSRIHDRSGNYCV